MLLNPVYPVYPVQKRKHFMINRMYRDLCKIFNFVQGQGRRINFVQGQGRRKF